MAQPYTLTSSFILPIFNIGNIRRRGLINAYLGFYPETKDEWGKSVYLLMNSDIDAVTKEEIEKHKQYVRTIKDGDNLLFELKINEDYNDNIIKPFLMGKYSLIDRDYVRRYFPQWILDPQTGERIISTNYKILNKWDSLKEFQENRIGVTLPAGAEVWDIPTKEREIYKYETNE